MIHCNGGLPNECGRLLRSPFLPYPSTTADQPTAKPMLTVEICRPSNTNNIVAHILAAELRTVQQTSELELPRQKASSDTSADQRSLTVTERAEQQEQQVPLLVDSCQSMTLPWQ